MPIGSSNIYFHSKDRNPEETVSRIREILTSLGLHVYEVDWGEGLEGCHYVRIELEELPGVGTNGKGISRPLALASAYAEFIERLQNNFLVFPDQFGLMDELGVLSVDQAFVPLKTLQQKRHLWECLVNTTASKSTVGGSHEALCAPYLNIATNDVELLPFVLLTKANGSSGMCAGNTPHEALVQGFGEVLERHIITRVFSDDPPTIPTIPHAAIADLEAYALVKKLESEGRRVLVKDCTLGGQIPVLGVIACDPKNGEYQACFGSDPLIEIALQRCITEMFQGYDERSKLPLDFSSSQYAAGPTSSIQKNRRLAQSLCIRSSEGSLPNYLFFSQDPHSFEKAFLHQFESNEASLRFLVERIRSIASDIFVRDVSFLGFPAFHLYVPELSNAFGRCSEVDLEYMSHADSIKRCLLGLEKCTTAELKACAALLSRSWEEHRHDTHMGRSLRRFDLITDGESDIEEFKHTEYLLALLYQRLGVPERAFDYLAEYLSNNAREIDNLQYYLAALVYLRSRAAGDSTGRIAGHLKNLFDEQLAQEIIEDLSHPENAFQYLELPMCGNCDTCQMEEHCLYESWKPVKRRLLEEMQNNPIDQARVMDFFRT